MPRQLALLKKPGTNCQGSRLFSKKLTRIAKEGGLFLGDGVVQHGTNLGRAGGCRLRTAATSGSRRRIRWCSWVAGADLDDQVDRFVAVAIGDLRVGAFLEQVANEIRPARLRRYVKSRHAFVRGGRAGVAHRIRLRTGDLSIHVRAVLKKQVHQRESRASAP